MNFTFAPSNNRSVTLFSQCSPAFNIADRRLNIHSNLEHWKNKIFIISQGGFITFFFLTTSLIHGQKLVTRHIRWKWALTLVKSFHNQNYRERIPSIAKRTGIAQVTLHTPTNVNHMTRTNWGKLRYAAPLGLLEVQLPQIPGIKNFVPDFCPSVSQVNTHS